MNKTTSLFIAVILVTLSACDYYSSKLKIIDNQSDYDLQVYIHNGSSAFYRGDTSFLVPHKSELEISYYSTPQNTYETGICEIDADSITSVVTNNDTLSATINLSGATAWIYHVIDINEKHGRGTSQCRRVITNADIE